MCRILAGRMDLHVPGEWRDRISSGLKSQVGRNEHARPPRFLLHRDVVVEFDPQDIDIGQALGHCLGPASRVRDVADLDGRLPSHGRYLDPKSKGRSTVVFETDRFDPQTVGRQERLIVVTAAKAGFFERLKTRVVGQIVAMGFVAIENDGASGELRKGGCVYVIGVGVGQDRRRDSSPTCADARESLPDGFGAHAGIDQQASASTLHKRGIPARSTGKHGKLN
jgi:hypothetical protein